MPIATLSDERAARRFHQVQLLEQQLAQLDARITDTKESLTAMKIAREAVIQRMRAAARDDEDTLPLFEDLDDDE